MQVGLEVLALPVQIFSFLCDAVEELQELLIGCDLHRPTCCVILAGSIFEQLAGDLLEEFLLLVEGLLDIIELLLILNPI